MWYIVARIAPLYVLGYAQARKDCIYLAISLCSSIFKGCSWQIQVLEFIHICQERGARNDLYQNYKKVATALTEKRNMHTCDKRWPCQLLLLHNYFSHFFLQVNIFFLWVQWQFQLNPFSSALPTKAGGCHKFNREMQTYHSPWNSVTRHAWLIAYINFGIVRIEFWNLNAIALRILCHRK